MSDYTAEIHQVCNEELNAMVILSHELGIDNEAFLLDENDDVQVEELKGQQAG